MGTEIIRNLMSVRTITNVEPIEGADRIVLATIDDDGYDHTENQ